MATERDRPARYRRPATPAFSPGRVQLARSVRVERAVVLSAVTVLILSTWGPAVLLIGGFYVPELLLPPLAVYLWLRRPRLASAILRCVFSPAAVVGALWLTLVAAIGVLSRGSVVGPYSEWRASLILLYSCLFAYSLNARDIDGWSTRLMWISFAVLCLDAALAGVGILQPGLLGQRLPGDEEAAAFGLGRVSVPAITVVACAYLAARARRTSLLAATVLLGGVLSFGGHRVVLLATLVSALFLPLVTLGVIRSRSVSKRWLRVAVLPLLILVALSVFRSSAIRDYLEEARGIQNRLFTHTMETIEGIRRGVTGQSSIDYGDEAIRAAYAAYVFTEWPALLIPRGLGSREVAGQLGTEFDTVAARFRVAGKDANTHDNAVLYMAYHHGLLMTACLAMVIGWLFLRRLAGEASGLSRAQLVVAVLGILSIDLVYPPVPGINIACVYGLFLGTLLNRAGAGRVVTRIVPKPGASASATGRHAGVAR
jgi:hypothetical protein